MKNSKYILWVILIVSSFFISCARQLLTGIVSYKEYDKAHISTNTYYKKFISVDSIKIVSSYPARNGKVGPILVKSRFKVWIADNNRIRTFRTDSVTWSSINCGERITYDPLSKSLKK
jgi:hypothetical protein